MRCSAPRFAALVAVLALATAPPSSARPARPGPAVIFDAIAAVGPVLTTNYTADLTALAAAKGVLVLPAVGGIDATLTLYPDLPAEVFATIEQNALPGLGLMWDRVVTQARHAQQRENMIYGVADYFARGKDPVVLGNQLKLAAETILHRIDQIAGTAGAGVFGAGEARGSVEIVQLPIGVGQDYYEGRFLVRFPIQEEDIGLT